MTAADDSTLIAIMPSPGVTVTVAESLSRDLVKVSEWCYLSGMTLNASKTNTMIVSRSRIMYPQSPSLTNGGTVLKESDDLLILGVTFDPKLTFETFQTFEAFHRLSRAVSQRLGIEEVLANISCWIDSWEVLSPYWPAYLAYCSALWCSAANRLLEQLCRVVSGALLINGGVFESDITHRLSVAVLCMLHN